jgi:prefoldin alpha subunit
MDQEKMMQASQLERKHQELEQFNKDLSSLKESKASESISSLGKGVYLKTKIENKDSLYIEVGSGIVIKKTPEETQVTITGQIQRLQEARIQITSQLEIYHAQLQSLVTQMQE